VRRIFPGTFGRKPGVDQVIDWASVASLADDGGVVCITATREALSKLRPADIADIIEDLEGREQRALIELLDPDLAADALEEMEDDELQGLLRGISDERAAQLLSHMEPDESAEVLRDLDEEHSESILAQMAPAMAKQLRRLVEFDETHAGGIMTTHILIVKESDTVSDALKLLVEHRERDISDGVTVVDSKGKLLDHIQIIELIAAKPSEKLETLARALPNRSWNRNVAR
jgi:Mg/Co/Ni transporter MgtE